MIKELLIVFLLILFTRPGFSQQSSGEDNFSRLSKGDQLAVLGERYHELGRFSGTILIQEDTFSYCASYGKSSYHLNRDFTSNTAFKVGELSNLFTRALFQKLVQQKSIAPEDLVTEYLPEIDKRITLQQLLDHTSGLQKTEVIKKKNPGVPFSAVDYANLSEEGKNIRSDLNYILLENILEKISGQDYSEMLQNFSEETSLKNTFFGTSTSSEVAEGYTHSFKDGNVVVQPSVNTNNSELKTTAADLHKVLRYLSEEKIEINGYTPEDGFSYAVQKNARRYIIILSNRRHPVAGEIMNSINAIFKGEKFELPLARKEIEIETDLLVEYAGAYKLNPEMQLQVITSNDSLFVLMGPQKVHLKPQSQNQFFMEQGDSAIRFLRDEEGKVSSAELLDGFLTGNKIEKVK